MEMKFYLWMFSVIIARSASETVLNDNPALAPRFYNLNWMRSIPEDVPVSAVTMPGTHQSLTEYGGPLTQRQVWNLSVQLKAGIRYLDIHVGIWIPNQQHVYVWDGWWMISQQIRMDEVLVIIFNFLELHPSETVLLNVEIHGLYKSRVLQMIMKMISQNRDRIWSNLAVPTMGQARGKLIFVKSSTFDVGVEKSASAFFLDNKLDYCECKIEQVKPQLCGRSIVVTENPSAFFTTPKMLAQTVNSEINKCVMQNKRSLNQGCLGVISMNFPSPDVLKNIIQLRPCRCGGEPQPMTVAPPAPPTEPRPEEPPPCGKDREPMPPMEPCPEEPPPCGPDTEPTTEPPCATEPPPTEPPCATEPPITEPPCDTEPPTTEPPCATEPPTTEPPRDTEPPTTEPPCDTEPPTIEPPCATEPPICGSGLEPTSLTEPCLEASPTSGSGSSESLVFEQTSGASSEPEPISAPPSGGSSPMSPQESTSSSAPPWRGSGYQER